MNVIVAKAPGKLYIAGEYAVLEPEHPAIIVALNQFITVYVEGTENQGTIRSGQYGDLALPWIRKNGQLMIDQRENPFTYITEAATITERYVKELGKELHFFNLTVESELDNHDGKKYGLGSSGAVTVATIKALLTFYEIPYTSEMLYKLAALTHIAIQSNGSFGDLAASSYGGWIAYACFDKEWVRQQLETHSIKELLALEWPLLRIQPLKAPADLQLMIGWTGTPASTAQLVDLIKEEKHEMNGFYHKFLAESKQCVEAIIQAFLDQNLAEIELGIHQNRALLKKLAEKSGVQIETPLLTQLCQVAEKYSGAAKTSGAGGGDCGIAILNRQYNVIPLIKEWEKLGITHLPLQVYQEQELEKGSY